MFRTILSLLVVFTLLNTYVGKTIHELFFHHEGVHCDAVNEKHFHTIEYHGEDLVCTFNFSASSETYTNNVEEKLLFDFQKVVTTQFNFFSKNNFQAANALRGPPFFSYRYHLAKQMLFSYSVVF